MILIILTIFTLNAWWIEFIRLSYSLTKLIRLIPKSHLFDLDLSISNGFVSAKIYNKRADFDFDKEFFSFSFMVTFSVLAPAGLTFLNLCDLLECVVM